MKNHTVTDKELEIFAKQGEHLIEQIVESANAKSSEGEPLPSLIGVMYQEGREMGGIIMKVPEWFHPLNEKSYVALAESWIDSFPGKTPLILALSGRTEDDQETEDDAEYIVVALTVPGTVINSRYTIHQSLIGNESIGNLLEIVHGNVGYGDDTLRTLGTFFHEMAKYVNESIGKDTIEKDTLQ